MINDLKNIEKKDDANSGSDSEDTEDNPYKVLPLKNNKSDLYQPECSENEIVPKLPFGGLVTGKSGSGKM